MEKITVNNAILEEAQNIVEGVYKPLKGFVNEKDFYKIAQEMKLENGEIWAMPIILDLSEEEKERIGNKNFVITNGDSAFYAINPTYYIVDKEKLAKSIFGTDNKNHPGVKKFTQLKKYFVGCEIKSIPQKEYKRNSNIYKTPDETKEIFKNNGWYNIVAFQTRNPPHRSHEFLQKQALSNVDGLFVQPIIGEKKKGDIKDEFIIGAYEKLIENYYDKNTVNLGSFHTFMRYAGPRDAVFHALVRRNFGCTHMIIGRDHAGVGDFYGTYDAQNIFDKFNSKELGIDIFKYNNVSYCAECLAMVPDDTCAHQNKSKIYLSGTELRNKLSNKEEITDKFMRKEVSQYLLNQSDIFV